MREREDTANREVVARLNEASMALSKKSTGSQLALAHLFSCVVETHRLNLSPYFSGGSLDKLASDFGSVAEKTLQQQQRHRQSFPWDLPTEILILTRHALDLAMTYMYSRNWHPLSISAAFSSSLAGAWEAHVDGSADPTHQDRRECREPREDEYLSASKATLINDEMHRARAELTSALDSPNGPDPADTARRVLAIHREAVDRLIRGLIEMHLNAAPSDGVGPIVADIEAEAKEFASRMGSGFLVIENLGGLLEVESLGGLLATIHSRVVKGMYELRKRETRLDRLVRWTKNHRVVALVLVTGTLATAANGVLDLVRKVVALFQ